MGLQDLAQLIWRPLEIRESQTGPGIKSSWQGLVLDVRKGKQPDPGITVIWDSWVLSNALDVLCARHGDHTKAGRSALGPERLVDQADNPFQASPPSCDPFNSLVTLGRLSPQFGNRQPCYLPFPQGIRKVDR